MVKFFKKIFYVQKQSYSKKIKEDKYYLVFKKSKKAIMVILFILFMTIISKNRSVVNSEDCEDLIKKYYYQENDIFAFRNFRAFKELENGCNDSFQTSHYLEFIPNSPIIIDNTFRIKNIISQKYISFLRLFNMIYKNNYLIKFKNKN
jgi:hypothetical protein